MSPEELAEVRSIVAETPGVRPLRLAMAFAPLWAVGQPTSPVRLAVDIGLDDSGLQCFLIKSRWAILDNESGLMREATTGELDQAERAASWSKPTLVDWPEQPPSNHTELSPANAEAWLMTVSGAHHA